jgi:osmotically-inducible protein OsmY
MTRSSFTFALIATLLLSPCLGGCVVAAVGGAAAAGGVGYEAAQERGVNGTFSDMNLTSTINNELNNQYGNITVTVYAGRVLLTGSSPTPEAKMQAEQVASRTQGVSTVFNEIEVGPSEGAWDTAKDTWITGRVRSDLMFNADVRSGNYTIETNRQSVYLMGSARSQAELDQATQLARYVPGVQRVVSYVEIRYGNPTAQLPGTSQAGMPPGPASPPATSPSGMSPPPTSPSGPPPSGLSPSNAPIQVQKL